jgi:hypothetical protein
MTQQGRKVLMDLQALVRFLIPRSRLRQLRAFFPRPVRIVFGTDDPHLNTRVARGFAQLSRLRY